MIGYIQYFAGLPPVVVGLHMFGACLVWIAAVYVVLMVRSEHLRDAVDRHADDGADQRAVEPDELKVPSDLQL